MIKDQPDNANGACPRLRGVGFGGHPTAAGSAEGGICDLKGDRSILQIPEGMCRFAAGFGRPELLKRHAFGVAVQQGDH